MPQLPVPTEDTESATFANNMRRLGLRFGHINNELYTTSWTQKARTVRLGSPKGIPDYIVVIPPDRSTCHKGHLLFIEMKRQRGGVTSTAQKEWIEALNGMGEHCVEARVCKGSREAVDFVSSHLIPQPDDNSPF